MTTAWCSLRDSNPCPFQDSVLNATRIPISAKRAWGHLAELNRDRRITSAVNDQRSISGMVHGSGNEPYMTAESGLPSYIERPYMAEATRIELAVAGLEAAGLPLTDASMEPPMGVEPILTTLRGWCNPTMRRWHGTH